MSQRTVVIVDPYSSGNQLAPALIEAGFRVVAAMSTPRPPAIYAKSFRPDDFERVVRFDGDVAATAREFRALGPAAVIPGAEPGVELADRLAALLTPGLANAPDLTSARRHKGDMTAAAAAAGLATIPTFATDSAEQLSSWLGESGLAHKDIVLKPAKSGGTDGVTLVRAGQDWRPAFESLLANPNGYGVRNEQVVAQEYVRGTEYLVDTFSFDGRHTVDVIARYGKVNIAGRIAVYESIEFIEFDAVVAGYAKGVLDALGIRFGPAHTEIIVTETGPVLVECGARLAGSGLPSASRSATRMNVIDRLVRYLDGRTDIPDAYRLFRTVMVVFLLLDRGGVVRNAEVYEEIRALPTIKYFRCDVRDGDVVRPSSDLAASLNHGLALLVGSDREAVFADRRAIREIESKLALANENR